MVRSFMKHNQEGSFRLLEKFFLKFRFNLFTLLLHLKLSVSSPNFFFVYFEPNVCDSTLISSCLILLSFSLTVFFFFFCSIMMSNKDKNGPTSIFFYNHSEALQLLLNVPECTAVIFTHPSLRSSCRRRHVFTSHSSSGFMILLRLSPIDLQIIL